MLNPTFLEVLKYEGVATIISDTEKGYHVVNTWNSYIRVPEGVDRLYIPAAGMHHIEQDVAENPTVLFIAGSKEVPGLMGPGTGFHLKATAHFESEGAIFDKMFAEFPFISRVLILDVKDTTQKI